jgi:hypothetical protein
VVPWKVSLIGSRTCASVSASTLDAQPAQAESEVRRMGGFVVMGQSYLTFGFFWIENCRGFVKCGG